jgi:thiamine transport system substrate-binding protein
VLADAWALIIISLKDAVVFGGEELKQFFYFFIIVLSSLIILIFYKNSETENSTSLPILRVYTYSSFLSQWGPGPLLKDRFEIDCQCKIQYIDAGEGALFVQKIKNDLDAGVDLVLGFDQFDLPELQKQIAWRPVSTTRSLRTDITHLIHKDSPFLPFDWGVLAFVTKSTGESSQGASIDLAPKSLDSWIKSLGTNKISLQDPRTSTPGLQFLLWLIRTEGEEKAFEKLAQLQKNIHSYSSSWSSSYGLFQKNQVQWTWSYITSPIYHQIEEKDDSKRFLPFKEPLPVQLEYLGVPDKCKQCDLALRFVEFVYTDFSQKIIMSKNYMLPVVDGVTKGTAFENIRIPSLVDYAASPGTEEKERILARWSELRRKSN